jgi:Protein of unknown function (DUF3072)
VADRSNMQKDPADGTTGDEPITGAQRSNLKTLCEEANEPFEEGPTRRRRPSASTSQDCDTDRMVAADEAGLGGGLD